MRMLMMLPYALDTAPSQRFRIEQWAPRLRREGVVVEAAPLLSLQQQRQLHASGSAARKAAMLLGAALRRVGQARDVRRYDIIWLHRTAWLAGPPLLERWLARSGVPLVF